jgi:putative tricarboxylic transport membrane protein
LGWVLTKLDWPRPPLILGLVLGPLAENRLFLSTDNYGLAWLLRPGVLVILAITIIGAVYPFLKTRIRKRQILPVTPAVPQTAEGGGERLRFGWEAAFSLFIVIVFILALWESRHFDIRAGLFPWAIGFPALGLGITQFIKDILGKESRPPTDHPADEGPGVPTHLATRRTFAVSGWIIGYFLMIWLLGFSLGGALCAFIHLKFGSREKWLISTVLTLFAWCVIYGVFDRALHVPFPTGVLLVWLNLAT